MTNPDLSKLLADVRAAEAKMTPAPWELCPRGYGEECDVDGPGGIDIYGTHRGMFEKRADAEGTMVFRNSILPLCDAVERLQRDLDLARGAMQAQDNREKAAGEKCGVPYASGGCDWPDEVAEEVLRLQRENDELRKRRGVSIPLNQYGIDPRL